jgi:exodeoxyribonuclease V alpha subunit
MSETISLDVGGLDERQAEAVRACVDPTRRVVAITGKAGTGKTTIIRHVHDLLTRAGYTVKVGAPTGKAAKRVKEATGIQCTTFHRLLEFTNPGERDEKSGAYIWSSHPKRHRGNPLDADVVIGDEYAMVNQELHGDITSALKPGGRLLVFGDANQLPPIEPSVIQAKQPSKFTELLAKFQGITLETIHRTGAGSGIADNGSRILHGFAPLRRDDFTIDMTPVPVDRLMAHLRTTTVNYNSLDNQIITPTNVSWVGQYKLNATIQSMLRPHETEWFELARHRWDETKPVRVCIGDKVVINQNLYSVHCNDNTQGVFNGETGIIAGISKWAEIELDLGDRIAVLPPEQIVRIGSSVKTVFPHREIGLAYALTTHKCQGSEYRSVVYMMNKSQFRQLNRYNFYTGVTRARQHVHLITDMQSMARACSNTTTFFG